MITTPPPKKINQNFYIQNYKETTYFQNDSSLSSQVLEEAGWTPVSIKNGKSFWRRPGKSKEHSAILNEESGIFYNFSTSADLPVGKGLTSFELVRFYCFSGNTAATIDFFNANRPTTQNDFTDLYNREKAKKEAAKEEEAAKEPVIYQLGKDYHQVFFYQFQDGSYIQKYKFENGQLTEVSKDYILHKFPNSTPERCYRISINESVFNRNKYSKGCELPNHKNFTSCYENVTLTIDGIRDVILNGNTICCSHLKNGYKNDDNYMYNELFFLDADGNQSVEEFLAKKPVNLLGIATTGSHTKEINRFRAIFKMDLVCKNLELANKIILENAIRYNTDTNSQELLTAFMVMIQVYF